MRCWLPTLLALAPTLQAQVDLRPGATVLFQGAGMMERLLEEGELSAMLHLAHPHLGLKVRHLAWTGDEVGHRLRAEGYAAHLRELLTDWAPQVVVVAYGQNESFAGPAGLPAFRAQAGALLDQIARLHPGATRVVLSPPPVESSTRPRQPDAAMRNADIQAYAEALTEVARARGCQTVDLITPLRAAPAPFTRDGFVLNETGLRVVARATATALLGEAAVADLDLRRVAELAPAAAWQAQAVAEWVRPKNGILYYGQRKRPDERAAEKPLYLERIAKADARLHTLAADPYLRREDLPPPPLSTPLPTGKIGSASGVGKVRSAAEALAEFQVAEGYAVNLFASEEQFPDLRAPVQIAFDARGRLWVVTMPSFPHTLPGQPLPDRLVVLEDLDRDGRADTASVFAEGFDALDGVAFHERGVIVSEQSRHWLLHDTDGDGRADRREEWLRGLDVTDTHHGGMIATDPAGGVWFCDGVFHRSQFETPFGVHRARDATTLRHDLLTGRITTEWQSDTPNPWKITFDRAGQPFQMYGGGHVLDGSALPWTPLGVYHPYGQSAVLNYGKGSGVAVVTGPNFPAAYQQGLASASLLGRYAVSLTRLDYATGEAKGLDRLDVLQSPNPAFRPVDLAFGLDGGLYVSDFSSAIIGHAQNPMRDPRWNHTRGRIWRVVHTAGELAKEWPALEGAAEPELFRLLSHPHDLVRQHARLAFRRSGARRLDELLAGLAGEAPEAGRVRLESAWIFEGLGQVRPALLDALARDPDPLHRAAAVRLIRAQADRLDDATTRLRALAADAHPRVRMAVIAAVSHLRPGEGSVESALAGIQANEAAVQRLLAALDFGTLPRVRPSLPVLEIAAGARVAHWAESAPRTFHTLVRAARATTALLSVRQGHLEVRVNGVLRLHAENRWSPEQQVPLELESGLNRIEITYPKLGKAGKPPPVHLSDADGRVSGDFQFPAQGATLKAWQTEYDRQRRDIGTVLHLQAAPGLQFSPRELRVKAGSPVRLIFENPDGMEHNVVIGTPGSREDLGTLAGALALLPDARERAYRPDSPLVLQASPLVPPHSRIEMTFTAPDQPATYPVLCTLPGHWLIMRADLVVEP
jgi:uncharacterized cupredoxin-like copper-binding protein